MTDGQRSWLQYLTFSVVTIVSLTVIGCSDELTPENSLAPPGFGDFTIRDTTVPAFASSSFRQIISMNSTPNLIGNSGGYTAYSLLQFLFLERDTVNVVSAKLTLHAVTWHGDSSATIGFKVCKINQSWQPTFSWDSLQTFPGFYDPAPRGSYSGSIHADTESIVVDLDTSMVREWLQLSTITSYGIILVPSNQNVVRGFDQFNYISDSTTFYPTLQIIARNVAGTVQDTILYNTGIDTFVGNVDLTPNPELLYVQSGVSYRSRINFDVSFIPHGAIINSAEMLVERNTAVSRISKFTRDTVIETHVFTSGTDTSQFEVLVSPTIGRRKTGSFTTFSFDIRRAVQIWVRGPNYGIMLRPGLNELDSFDLYAFYSSAAANTALRPRVKITYAVKK
jgi:hypothetical protein